MRLTTSSRIVIALLCVSLIAMRIGGAHVHLCLDGGEPPVSLHMGDSGVHHPDETASAPHSDQDVSIGQDLVAKKPFADVDPAVLAFAIAFLLLLATRGRGILPDFLSSPLPSARAYLRPPLRGPPR